MQARRTRGCPRRFLGASSECGNDKVLLYAEGEADALINWRLVKVG
jgi:hypothetical protein